MSFALRVRSTPITLAALAIMLFSLMPSAPIHAQVAGATLSGTITDPSGGAIPGAQVSIRNTATDVTRDVVTDSAGFYSAPNLLPGTYEVSFSATGFAKTIESNIVLEVGGQQALNPTMQVGQSTQTVQVTAEAPQVQLVSSAISEEVTSTTVRELPLNGRDWTQLATLQPGVSAVKGQAPTGGLSSRANRGFGNQLSDSGHRPYENNYRVNGISVNDYSNGSPGNVIGGNLGVDAIEEFSVVTSNYGAEYGRTSGAVINAITRSGTNQFHGSAYEFLRNSALDARNFFDPAQIPPFRRNQFGGTAGGPIKKDKIFIFGDYEGLRQAKSFSFLDKVPSNAARAGNLCSVPTTGTCTPTTVSVSPFIAPYLGFWLPPNAGLAGNSNGDLGLLATSTLAVLPENYGTVRVDDSISAKDSLDISYYYDGSENTQGDDLNVGRSASVSTRHMASIEENHIFSPTFTNTVRVGMNRTFGQLGRPAGAINPLAADKSLGLDPSRNPPQIAVNGGITTEAGTQGVLTAIHALTTFQGYDDAFLTRGAHSIKFGFAMERIDDNEYHPLTPNGTVTFASFENFLADIPKTIQSTVPGESRGLGARQSLFGAYIQDDWRARPNLTLNLGLRYEPTSMLTESHGQFQNIVNLNGGPQIPVHSFDTKNNSLTNFEPRVGLAWDPFHDGKTAVRGGFGIFDVLKLPWQYVFNASSVAPFSIGDTIHAPTPGESFQQYGSLLSLNPAIQNELSDEQNSHRNYAMNWNLNVQRELSPNLTVMVGYVGSRTIHQSLTVTDMNTVLPTLTSAGYLWPFPVGSGTQINPGVGGALSGTLWDNSASYNSGQVQVTKKLSNGFQIQGSYTYGKCLDMGSSGFLADPFVTSLSSIMWFTPGPSHGPCDFDQRHNLVLNYLWTPPTPKFAGPIGEHLLGGWQLGGVITVASGSPTSLVIAGDPLGQNSSDTYNYPDRIAGPGCSNPINPGNPNDYFKLQCFTPPTAPASFAAVCQPAAASVTIPNTCMNLLGNTGRNSIYGPGFVDFDFSLFKNIPIKKISEVSNLQFRAEFFNIMNKPNFQAPNFGDGNDTLFNQDGTPAGGAGVIDATTTDARQIQFGLKFSW